MYISWCSVCVFVTKNHRFPLPSWAPEARSEPPAGRLWPSDDDDDDFKDGGVAATCGKDMGAASVKLGASRKLQSDAFDDFLFDDQKVSIGKWYNQMFFMILYLMIRKLQWLIDDQSESYTYMANQKVTLRWPIRKLHLDDQSESHTLMTNKKVTSKN